MAKDHIVQEKYLRQWAKPNTKNKLQAYSIPENKYIEKNTKSPCFYRKNYNILDSDTDKNLPERITALIDDLGIKAIRNIDCQKRIHLAYKDRRAIAFYVALQYIRTPRYREELDKLYDTGIKYFMRRDIDSVDKMSISKENLLSRVPTNKEQTGILTKLTEMSEEDINKLAFEALQGNGVTIGLNSPGHSEEIIKNINILAEGVFSSQWDILSVTSGATFNTSDNPCFTIAGSKFMHGLLSPSSIIIFPLRPDVCIYIKPGVKSRVETYTGAEKKFVEEINESILHNSYQCVVSKDKDYLENLVNISYFQKHRKSREVVIYEQDENVIFNFE